MQVCPSTEDNEHTVSPSDVGQDTDAQLFTFVFRHEQCGRFDESYTLEHARLSVGDDAVCGLVFTWTETGSNTRMEKNA
jgi:hypothetical protein